MARSTGVPIETPVSGTNKVVLSRIEVADLIRPTTQMAPLFGEATDDQLVIEEHVPLLSGEHAVISSRDSLQVPVVDLRASGLVPIESGPVTPLAEESTAPLSLSQDEAATMTAIAAANNAALQSVVIDEGGLATRGSDAEWQRGVIDETATIAMEPLAKPESSESGEMTALDKMLASRPLDRSQRPSVEASIDAASAPTAIDGAAPQAIDDVATDSTQRSRSAPTTLGVAPLLPATTVSAPFVIDTPVERWKPVRPAVASIQPPNRLGRSPSEPPPMADKLAEAVASTVQASTRIPTVPAATAAPDADRSLPRTAIIALDPNTGVQRSGPWQALASAARSLKSVRWWRRRQTAKTTRVKPI